MAFRNNNYEEKEYIENLVALNRVSKTVKGGRVARFAALMVVGVIAAIMVYLIH